MKSRFIADNQTDMDIEIKQKGTPDILPTNPAALEGRCAVRLRPRERCFCNPDTHHVILHAPVSGWRELKMTPCHSKPSAGCFAFCLMASYAQPRHS